MLVWVVVIFTRLVKPPAAVWNLAVQILGIQQGSFSRLSPRESLKTPHVFIKASLGFKCPRLPGGVKKVCLTV